MPIAGTDLVGHFPCHPTRVERTVDVAGRPLALALTSCDQAGVAYGVATGDVEDPTRVEAVLSELAESARAGVRASSAATGPTALAGETPYRGNLRMRLAGQGADGRPIEESVALFARGTRVFQVTAAGAALPEPAARPFEEGLRFKGFR